MFAQVNFKMGKLDDETDETAPNSVRIKKMYVCTVNELTFAYPFYLIRKLLNILFLYCIAHLFYRRKL